LKRFLAIYILFFSGACFSGAYTDSQEVLAVSSLHMNTATYGNYFTIKGSWSHSDGSCPTEPTLWIVSSTDTDELKSMYSMALSAFTSKNKVALYQEGCVSGRPKTHGMYLPSR
jgi:hypothetical protein